MTYISFEEMALQFGARLFQISSAMAEFYQEGIQDMPQCRIPAFAGMTFFTLFLERLK